MKNTATLLSSKGMHVSDVIERPARTIASCRRYCRQIAGVMSHGEPLASLRGWYISNAASFSVRYWLHSLSSHRCRFMNIKHHTSWHPRCCVDMNWTLNSVKRCTVCVWRQQHIFHNFATGSGWPLPRDQDLKKLDFSALKTRDLAVHVVFCSVSFARLVRFFISSLGSPTSRGCKPLDIYTVLVKFKHLTRTNFL